MGWGCGPHLHQAGLNPFTVCLREEGQVSRPTLDSPHGGSPLRMHLMLAVHSHRAKSLVHLLAHHLLHHHFPVCWGKRWPRNHQPGGCDLGWATHHLHRMNKALWVTDLGPLHKMQMPI